MFRDIAIEIATGDPDTETSVTAEDVTQFIEDADSEIDMVLSDYYVTPISGVESLKYIAVISKYKVAHVIKTILETTSQISDREQEVQTNLGKKADKLLYALVPSLVNGKLVDPVVSLSDATKKLNSPENASVFGHNYTGVRTPTVTKGGNNW